MRYTPLIMDTHADMSPPGSPERITLECTVDDQRTEAFALRHDFTVAERAGRAARTFGILFGVACFSVFIPLLHFVLPPLFLLLGAVLAAFAWAETAEVVTGEFTCPNCRRVTGLPRGAEEWPKQMRCPGCSFTLTLAPPRPS